MQNESGIKYTIIERACPHCGNKFATEGLRRFGPAVVRCDQCQSMVATGLPEWAALTTTQKVLMSLAEIILPSWMNATGCMGISLNLLLQLFLWAMVPFPLYVLLMMLDPGAQSGFTILAGFLFTFTYPAILIRRLRKIIRESQDYTRKKIIPVWGKQQKEDNALIGRYQNKKYRLLLRFLGILLGAGWIYALFLLVNGIVVISGGKTTVVYPNNVVGTVLMLAAHFGGAFVVAELSRSLGSSKNASFVFAFLTVLAAPIVLPISAFSRRRTQ